LGRIFKVFRIFLAANKLGLKTVFKDALNRKFAEATLFIHMV